MSVKNVIKKCVSRHFNTGKVRVLYIMKYEQKRCFLIVHLRLMKSLQRDVTGMRWNTKTDPRIKWNHKDIRTLKA